MGNLGLTYDQVKFVGSSKEEVVRQLKQVSAEEHKKAAMSALPVAGAGAAVGYFVGGVKGALIGGLVLGLLGYRWYIPTHGSLWSGITTTDRAIKEWSK